MKLVRNNGHLYGGLILAKVQGIATYVVVAFCASSSVCYVYMFSQLFICLRYLGLWGINESWISYGRICCTIKCSSSALTEHASKWIVLICTCFFISFAINSEKS